MLRSWQSMEPSAILWIATVAAHLSLITPSSVASRHLLPEGEGNTSIPSCDDSI